MKQFVFGAIVGGSLTAYIGSGWVMSAIDHLPQTKAGLLSDLQSIRIQLNNHNKEA